MSENADLTNGVNLRTGRERTSFTRLLVQLLQKVLSEQSLARIRQPNLNQLDQAVATATAGYVDRQLITKVTQAASILP